MAVWNALFLERLLPVLSSTVYLVPKFLPHCSPWDESRRVTESKDGVIITHSWDELRHLMWDYVGIVRSTKRLEHAKHRCEILSAEIGGYYHNFRISNELIELRNLILIAQLIIRSALLRKESSSLHYTTDFPEPVFNSTPRNIILTPANFLA